MAEKRLNIRLDPVTEHDLEQLARRLNITHTAVVRQMLREGAERRGILRLNGEHEQRDA